MAKLPAETHNGNLNRSEIKSAPSSGARQMAGKSNEPDANLKFSDKKPETVTTVDMNANAGACIKAGLVQAQGDGAEKNVTNGNPKKRESNSWGLHHGEEK